MKSKIKYLIVFFGFMFIAPLTSQAECSYERQAELSRIAANVQFSYNYEFENGTPIFTINMTNLTNDIYITTRGNILNQDKSYINRFNGEGERTVRFSEGTTAQFDIFSNDGNCYGEKALTKYVTLPTYNSYSNRDECQKYPNFKYCQMWSNLSISTTTFENDMNNYKKQLLQTASNDQTNNWLDSLKVLISKWYIKLILIVFVIGAIIFSVIKIKQHKEKRY